MRQRRPIRSAAGVPALAALLLATLSAPLQAGPVDPVPPLPQWTGPLEPQDRDERGLWMMSGEDETILKASPFLITDPALNAYVQGVLCRTVGPDRCKAVRLYIMRVPAFNASMAPNGVLQLWSGALLRMKNETELAAVLGHEFAHYELRHALAGFKQARAASDAAMWLAFIPYAGLALSLGALQGFFVFNQAQEKAADLESFAFLQASPYRAASFADIWERLSAENDAGRLARGQQAKGGRQKGFFATHPSNAERMAYLRAMGAAAGDKGDEATASYLAGLGGWRKAFLEDQIKLNDFGGTEWLLADLAKASGGWSGDMLFARGELYRLRGQPGDMTSAIAFYREAIAKGFADPDGLRGLGLALLRGGGTPDSKAEGQAMLARYLEQRPQASDAAMLRMLAGVPTPQTGTK